MTAAERKRKFFTEKYPWCRRREGINAVPDIIDDFNETGFDSSFLNKPFGHPSLPDNGVTLELWAKPKPDLPALPAELDAERRQVPRGEVTASGPVIKMANAISGSGQTRRLGDILVVTDAWNSGLREREVECVIMVTKNGTTVISVTVAIVEGDFGQIVTDWQQASEAELPEFED